MKPIYFKILVITFLFAFNINAQNQTTRFNLQHRSEFQEGRLEQTKKTLLEAMESKDSHMQTTALQTLRDLEIIFPEDKFTNFIEPLIIDVKDENENTTVRILSMLALENLHSDKGDAAIYFISQNTLNKSVKDISVCMAYKSFNEDNELSMKK